ncbi:myotubularin-related protein 4 isoform X1 [Colias croceus]|uniref:myotubularin-related protein 4 isoform X1 n=2 Tax=Colias crocea TaxID=72248 RepID=UPI001E27FE20|nr:myotubularin-related protein 4 isoform X1 [Colias croceus]XP_045503306.1 myotubularin-related protein 4 isoform X1 [Colias croceus]XP_045503307.1 myotubularin-related protein 4 isoform X1 [Colias croceus]
MLINTFLDTEDFVHLYYPEDEPPAAQGCGAGARMASKYPPRPPSPEYKEVATASSEMSDRERYRAPPQPEPPPHRVRASDLYPRQRTHYDEPGLDAGFTPICGEFVQWVGRTSDGGTIAMSNYRLHLQPRRRNGAGSSVPLRLIDALEIRDLLCLIVLCKHGRQLKCSFNTGEQCLEWWRRLGTALTPITSLQETFAAAYAAWAKEQPPSSVHRALMSASHAPQRHWFGPELERLGFSPKGPWRVTAANAEYKLCSSYPPLLIVPATIGDEQLESVARFRAMRRIPAVVWRHRGTGAVIARSSQPEVGWFGWRSSDDEGLLAAFVAACNADKQTPNKQLKLLIVDARSFASAVTNRARGGGCECQQYYPHADIQFMSLPNIHHVRKSFQQLRALVAEPSDQANWHSNLERTLWPQYLSGIARAASGVARAVCAGRPVLVHCSDGWDRTPQLVAAAQLLLDPHYRTLEGFRTLIEREWLDFGHKFAERCGHQVGGEDPNERSPIFLQWLHLVYQLMLQFPCAFEFNEAYLIKLATHVHSCMFGTFLCNSRRERADCAASTPHVWHLLAAPAYRNHLYAPNHDQVIWPECSVRSMQIWWGGLGGVEGEGDAEGEARALDPPPAPLFAPDAAPTLPHNGFMTKTRSCDNLLNEGEKRTTQRRCSDPSIAPDVIKLSLVVNGRTIEGEKEKERSECGVALTDSCVDSLPQTCLTHAESEDQVVSLHPDYFDSQPRDITSNSSSLERELASVAENKQTDEIPLVNGDVSVDVTDSGTPVDERNVFDCDLYTDVIEMADTSREVGRTRNISITWRSISESSNQSSTGFDIPENSPQSRIDPSPPRLDQIIDNRSSSDRDTPTIDNRNSSDRETPIIDNCNSTEGDIVNHNVVNGSTNHNRENGVSNGSVNGIVDVTAKFLEVELNGGGVSSSGASSESDGETREVRTSDPSRGSRVPSQLTLCPASPRRPACCHCSTGRYSAACWCGVCGAGAGAGECSAVARCVCGAGAAHTHHSLDGLPPADNPTQARLHQIILYQKKVVEELSGQLREAREALRRASPPAPQTRPPPPPIDTHTVSSSGSSGASGSSSGSASEVEVGEEARGVVWLPDSAAPRCQHCRNPFWLARRRHHCRLCGGIFCGSCSEMSSWGEVGAVRVCRRCRALR